MREWQSFLQIMHLCVISGQMELQPSFLCALLSAAAVISLSSLVGVVLEHSSVHFERSSARPSQDIVRISYADNFISQVRAVAPPPMPAHSSGHVFWDATILHTANMTQPSQSAWSKESVHPGKTSTRH